MDKKERRKNIPPIPERDRLTKMLTAEQVVALRRLENYGWQLKYVRRPLFQDPVPILFNAVDKRYTLLDPEGNQLPLEGAELRKDDL